MAAPMFDFVSARRRFNETVEHSMREGDISEVQQTFNHISGSDNEKKGTLDQALRDALYKLIGAESAVKSYTSLIHLATVAVSNELCSASTPFIMLSDLFDSITLDKCSDIFKFVEERVDTWKSDTFHTAGKNYLLRMCNDLLRRLSKSQNTLFCGRIQLFLARLFPLAEKSGLNLMSQFNLENVTYYNTKPGEYNSSRKQSVDSMKDDDTMEVEEGEMKEKSSSIPIDYNLYRKFWSVQDYFRKPSQCYEKVPWKTFTNYSEEVLACFDSYKLDDVKTSRRKLDHPRESQSHTYFAKYLTSEKLLDLQLSDSNFRRYVLVQFLIHFQYLNAPVKFKSPQQVLSDEQSAWLKTFQAKVCALLRETPPDGDKFAASIEHILSREENWSSWKNEGCPSYVREPKESSVKQNQAGRSRKRSIGDDMKASGGKLIKMGNAELTRLWNISPDNMAACQTENRASLPTLESFFDEAAEQLDPEQMVENEYKLINNKNWTWRALRLLARRSPYFFAQSPYVGKSLAEYLTVTISKLSSELPGMAPPPQEGQVNRDMAEDEDINEMPAAEENIDKADDAGRDDGMDTVTTEQLERLAKELGVEWKKLALELNFGEDEIDYIMSTNSTATDSQRALQFLTLFREQEVEKATPALLRRALTEIGQVAIATSVFGVDASSQ